MTTESQPTDVTRSEAPTLYTRALIQFVEDETNKQRDCGVAYGALVGDPSVDWPAVNAAILERWSMAGLKNVKRIAWGGAP